MGKVTGIGGIFFKAKDPKAMVAWYEKHLGVPFGGQSYVSFDWRTPENPDGLGSTAFTFFKQDTKYFSPSESPFMINFRVKDLFSLLDRLKEEGVWVDEKRESHDYGKFGWIMDPEGNKIELWEPVGEKL
jgi:catechol 2,3-dioxygenase-like lactoylglutathione lyase family enzyme